MYIWLFWILIKGINFFDSRTRSGGLEATSPTGGYDHLQNCSPSLSGTKQNHPGQNPANGTNSTKGRCTAPISKVRVEKIEGGLMVAGVVVAANCQVALPAFGFLFILVGAVLTAASYRGPGQDEKPDHYAARVNIHFILFTLSCLGVFTDVVGRFLKIPWGPFIYLIICIRYYTFPILFQKISNWFQKIPIVFENSQLNNIENQNFNLENKHI